MLFVMTDAIARSEHRRPRKSHRRTIMASKGGVKPSDIKYVAVSHSHPDHIGNVAMFFAVNATGSEG